MGDELGAGPETLRGRDPAGGFGSVAGDRPGTTTEGARRTGEPASGSARAGGGGRDRAGRVGLSMAAECERPSR